MALALDSSVDGGDNGGSTNSLTFAFNNVAGDLLFVGFVGDNVSGGADDVTGVTYNGVACSLVAKHTAAGDRFLYLYLLSSPATGSNNVVISCTGSHYIIAGAVSYSGSNLSGQPDASTHTNTPSSATATTSLSSVADNCWHMLVEGGYDSNNPPVAGAGTTRRVYNAAFGAWGLFDSNAAKTPAGSVSLTTTYVNSTLAGISHVMASFKPTLPGQTPYPWQLKSQMGALLTQ